LRKFADPGACAALLTALELEVLDKRTWETQYQLIMALGATGCKNALPTIRGLAQSKCCATMRQMAVGDAMVRLQHTSTTDASPLFEALELARRYDLEVAAGAMRAVAMLRLKFDKDTAADVIEAVEEFADHSLTFWTAAASPGWPSEVVRPLLERCLSSPNEGTREAADLSMRGKYKTYKPL
jgi:hypothetical protein